MSFFKKKKKKKNSKKKKGHGQVPMPMQGGTPQGPIQPEVPSAPDTYEPIQYGVQNQQTRSSVKSSQRRQPPPMQVPQVRYPQPSQVPLQQSTLKSQQPVIQQQPVPMMQQPVQQVQYVPVQGQPGYTPQQNWQYVRVQNQFNPQNQFHNNGMLYGSTPPNPFHQQQNPNRGFFGNIFGGDGFF